MSILQLSSNNFNISNQICNEFSNFVEKWYSDYPLIEKLRENKNYCVLLKLINGLSEKNILELIDIVDNYNSKIEDRTQQVSLEQFLGLLYLIKLSGNKIPEQFKENIEKYKYWIEVDVYTSLKTLVLYRLWIIELPLSSISQVIKYFNFKKFEKDLLKKENYIKLFIDNKFIGYFLFDIAVEEKCIETLKKMQ